MYKCNLDYVRLKNSNETIWGDFQPMWPHNFSSSVRKASFFLPGKVKQLWCFGVFGTVWKNQSKCLIGILAPKMVETALAAPQVESKTYSSCLDGRMRLWGVIFLHRVTSYFQPVILESDCLLPHFPSYVIIPREWNSLLSSVCPFFCTNWHVVSPLPQIKTQQQLSFSGG